MSNDDVKVTDKVSKVIGKTDMHLNISPIYAFIKRAADIMLSLYAIILLSPILLITAVAIHLESPGPAIFKQKRVGKGGKIFTIYKFRSMYNDAERRLEELKRNNQIKGHMFKMKDDPRITKVGKLIRKTSIDELPQIFNILMGDMSLIGPRPPLIREVLEYENWHCLRLAVTPGLSGLWQISGRNTLSFDQMVRLDLHYVKKRSMSFDILVVFKTFRVFLWDKSAF